MTSQKTLTTQSIRHVVYHFRGVIQQEFPTAEEAKQYIEAQKNPTEYYTDIIFCTPQPKAD